MSILPKAIYRSMQSLLKYQWHFWQIWNKIILNFAWKHKRPQIVKTILKKENKAGGVMFPDFRLYCITKILSSKRHKNIHIDPWNWIESPETDPHLYGQLIYGKRGKNIQWGKDSFFNKWCWENWTAICKRIKLDYSLTPCTKINSKWIKGASRVAQWLRICLPMRGTWVQALVWKIPHAGEQLCPCTTTEPVL